LAFLDSVLSRPELYNTHTPFIVDAALDPAILQAAMESLVARHEQLRAGVELERTFR
jgi:hypothetical protein